MSLGDADPNFSRLAGGSARLWPHDAFYKWNTNQLGAIE